jgi:uncharacterized protein (DUF952 family)
MSMLIYKICHREEWAQAVRDGLYAGSAKDNEDHFMHFSTARQVMGTLEKHYADADDLMLVAVQEKLFGDVLKYEPARGDQMFPHLYGVLPLSFVIWARPIKRDAKGRFVLPRGVV